MHTKQFITSSSWSITWLFLFEEITIIDFGKGGSFSALRHSINLKLVLAIIRHDHLGHLHRDHEFGATAWSSATSVESIPNEFN